MPPCDYQAHIRDIKFTAAFDIDINKVGKDLSEAMYAEPNNTIKFADVPKSGVTVSRGMTHDGLGKYLSEIITKAPGSRAAPASRQLARQPRSRFAKRPISHTGTE